MDEEFDVIWCKGDGEMPEKAKHVVDAGQRRKIVEGAKLVY